MQRRVLTLASLVLVLLSPVVPAAEAGSTPAISLALSPAIVTYGGAQSAAGSIMADSPCPSGRMVELQQRPAGSSMWSTIATVTSGADGSYQVPAWHPTATASYRAL